MAKYSTFKYGHHEKYGATANPTGTGKSSRILLIDWANTGGYTGENEADYLLSWNIRRGGQYYVSPSGSGFDHVRPGSGTLIMDNTAGRYNPYNNPNVLPGRYFEFYMRDNANQVNYLVMSGKIADIKPVSGGWNQVQFDLIDGLQELYDQDVSCGPNFYVGLSASIVRTLAVAHWPVRWGTNIKSDTTPITLYELDHDNAGDAINSLSDAGLGRFFVARTGKATYYPRNYNSMTTYTMDQAVLLKEWVVPSPWEQVRNMITVICNRQVKQRLADIWWLSQPIFVAAGDTETFTAKYDAALDVSLKKYTANSAINGTGTDLTSSFSVSVDARKKSADISVTNNSAMDGYVIGVDLIGRQFTIETSEFPSNDSTSQTKYGSRRFKLDTPYLQDRNFAKAYAPIIKTLLKDARPIPVIQIEERPDIQYAPDLYDKVHATSAKLGIDDTFSVGMIEHEGEAGKGTITRLYLQKIIYNNSTITPAPHDPDLPEIPEIPDDIIGPINPIWPDWPINPPVDDCTNDFYAPPNQFGLTFNKTTIQAGENATAAFSCHLRGGQLYNTGSYLQLGAIWGDDAQSTVVVTATVDTSDVATAVLRSGSDSMYIFQIPGPVAVSGFKIYLPAGGSAVDYIRGDQIASGTRIGNVSTWILAISGLTPGDYIATEAFGSYNYGPGLEYGISVSLDGTSIASPVFAETPYPIAYPHTQRRFFQVGSSGNIYTRVNDDSFGDNDNGVITFYIFNATAETARKIKNFTASIHNVCA